MKASTSLRIIICIGVCYLTTPSIGQQNKPYSVRRVYLNTSASINSNGPATLQLNMYFNNGWAGFIAYDNANPESKNQPADYRAGSGEFLGLQFNYAPPVDELNLVTAGMGKVLTKPYDKAWVIATAGLSFGQYKENKFTRQAEEYYSFFGLFGGTSSNYNNTLENKTAFGLSTGIEAHANLFRWMGISTGAKVLLTNVGVFPSFNLGLDVGLMRPSKKNMLKGTD